MVTGTLRCCHHDVCQQKGIGVTASAANGSHAGTTEVRNLNMLTILTLTLSIMASSGFYCYEGGYIHKQPPRPFPSQKSLRQHQKRCHKGTKGEGLSMERAFVTFSDSKNYLFMTKSQVPVHKSKTMKTYLVIYSYLILFYLHTCFLLSHLKIIIHNKKGNRITFIYLMIRGIPWIVIVGWTWIPWDLVIPLLHPSHHI